jgi:putative IMPACT (imprinted ancient) family translation regulator
MKKFILILCLVFTTKLSFSTSVIFYSSKESIKKSNLIVEAKVVDIEKSTNPLFTHIKKQKKCLD